MIALTSDQLQNLDEVVGREWLITNGLGGYAAGTVAGANTRRYHGLLVAATNGMQRTVMLSRIETIAYYKGERYDLSTSLFKDGGVQPAGYRHLHQFRLEGTIPVWTWKLDDALVEQRVILAWEKNSTYVVFRLLEGTASLTLALQPLHALRDHHGESAPEDVPQRVEEADHYRIRRGDHGYALAWDPVAGRQEAGQWVEGIYWPEEAWRGYTDQESLFRFGTLSVELTRGEAWQLAATTERDAAGELARRWETVQQERFTRDRRLWEMAAPQLGAEAPDWIRQLTLAADQFIITVDRGAPQRTMLAGYPWFTDWGRDTMIALPGLCLATGRYEDARAILRSFARYLDHGMLPNRFPDEGEIPEYNTADATLWFFEAVGQTWEATGDGALLEELYPELELILRWHLRGTRYNILVDGDGLLQAGTSGTQLTWMDVMYEGRVFTPRHGKAVELSALWYNALRWMERFAGARNRPADGWGSLAGKTQQAFERFWNPENGYLFDVIDCDGEVDPSLRPNQLLALSLTHPILTDHDRAVAILEACEEHLLTPLGLRSLAPDHPNYHGQHRGPRELFDRAYHNGTVWAWLIGPFVRAWRRYHDDTEEETPLSFLDGLRRHLTDEALGTISEIFDGDASHEPRGCFAQAWSVSELLALWWEIHRQESLAAAGNSG